MTALKIRIDEDGAGEVIESHLLATLQAQQPQAANVRLTLSVEDAEANLTGGLTATTSYGWLLIKTLWVHDDQRQSGVGTALIEKAEQIALSHGCHGAWLDTSSKAARDFYLRRGYLEFGVLGNRPNQHPSHHRRWFMQKQLAAG